MKPTKPIPKQRRTKLAFWLAAAGAAACVLGLTSSSALASILICTWGQAGCSFGSKEADWVLITLTPPSTLKEANFNTGTKTCSGTIAAKASGNLRVSSLGRESQYKLTNVASNTSASIRGGARCRNRSTGAFVDNVDWGWKNVVNKQYRKLCTDAEDQVGTWGQLKTDCYYFFAGNGEPPPCC